MKTYFFLPLFSVAVFAQQAPQEIPASLPQSMRPERGGAVPSELQPQTFFGKAKNPALEAYDPYRGALTREGRDATLDELPDGKVLDTLAQRQVIQYGSLPTVAVTFGRPVSVLLMRHGKIVLPKRSEIIPPPADMMQVLTAKGSPYLYFQAKEGVSFPDDYPYTHVFVPMELEGRPIQFQIRLKVVSPRSDELLPLVILDMVGDFPEVLDDGRAVATPAGSSVSAVEAATEAGPVTTSGSEGGTRYYLEGTGPAPVSPSLARTEVRELFPTMIEMAKLYEKAVYDRVPGYGREQVVRFRPSSVANGRLVSGGIPAFRNPNDNQLYYMPWGYYYPEYDAVIYEVIYQNQTRGDLWFDYGLLKVLFGFEGVDRSRGVAAVSPENFEKTPPGQFNTLWVLVQGHGVNALKTPVRLIFPPSGLGATVPKVANPQLGSTSKPVTYREGVMQMTKE